MNWRATMTLTVEALRRVGLDVSPREVVRRLSTSQQQMICIAKALYRRPRNWLKFLTAGMSLTSLGSKEKIR